MASVPSGQHPARGRSGCRQPHDAGTAVAGSSCHDRDNMLQGVSLCKYQFSFDVGVVLLIVSPEVDHLQFLGEHGSTVSDFKS